MCARQHKIDSRHVSPNPNPLTSTSAVTAARAGDDLELADEAEQRLAAEAEGADGEGRARARAASTSRAAADERELAAAIPRPLSRTVIERADVERHDHLGRARVERVVDEPSAACAGDDGLESDRVGDVAGERLDDRDIDRRWWGGVKEVEAEEDAMLGSSLLALGASTKDCEHWATMGECEKNPGFMQTGCASACARLLLDTLPAEECARIWEEGGCARPSTLSQCKTTCLSRLKPTVTDDGEGNCWYWSTDGECEANPVWMKNTCPLSCAKLEQCAVAPASAACARTFECPPKRDEADDCPRAARGECRPSSVWH